MMTLSPDLRSKARAAALAAEILAKEATRLAQLYNRIGNAPVTPITERYAMDLLDTSGTENAITGAMADMAYAITTVGEAE